MSYTILIIEDDEEQFQYIHSVFSKFAYECIPSLEDWNDVWSPIFQEKPNDLKQFVDQYLIDNASRIDCVILDVRLLPTFDKKDVSGLFVILQSFEEYKLKNKLPMLPFPIIGKTAYKEQINELYKKGVTVVFTKSDIYSSWERLFYATITSINTYKMWLNQIGTNEHREAQFQLIMEQLVRIGAITSTKFGELDVYLHGAFEHVNTALQQILLVSLKGLDSNKTEEFFEIYELELKSVLGNEFGTFKNGLERMDWRQRIKKIIDEFNLDELNSFFQDILKYCQENKILDAIPLGNLAGIGLSAILKILKKSS